MLISAFGTTQIHLFNKLFAFLLWEYYSTAVEGMDARFLTLCF
jgi:hypothetical protein